MMEVILKKENLKNFSKFLSKLDENVSSRTIVQDDTFDESSLLSFVKKHIEVQNAIMMIKGFPDRNFTIFKSYCDEENSNYEKMLKKLFNKVICLKNLEGEERFIVKDCSDRAVDIFNDLESGEKLNEYIKLFNAHKKNIVHSNKYNLYEIKIPQKVCSLFEDDFLKWCTDAVKLNSYITLSICGFTIEEIKNNTYLKKLFSLFPNAYILFCGEYSIGVYILNENKTEMVRVCVDSQKS